MIAFNSWEYIFFLAVVVGGYWRLETRYQNILLLIASFVFYASWDWRFVFLLLFSTSVDFWAACAIARTENIAHRKWFLRLSIASNLIILGFFKYFGFFVDNFNTLMGHFGSGDYTPELAIILPIGLSFYTFQAIGYVVDVYRKTIPPAPSFISYMLFISFFPQLVAGPIERAKRMLPQYQSQRVFKPGQFMGGIDLILLGLVKKVVVADNIAYYVTVIFNQPEPSTLLIMTAAFGFGVQICADFSGYSDIARGSAKLMGIELMQNFNLPYLARNPADFWRRWHISLSNFVRDYIYIPLGGSHCPVQRYLLNILITWALMGLWHGAAWHYVAWGLFHGMLVTVHRLFLKRSTLLARLESPLFTVFSIGVTYVAVNFGWLLFRMSDFSMLGKYFSVSAIGASYNEMTLAFLMAVIFAFYSAPLALGLGWRWLENHSKLSFHNMNSLRIILYTLCLLCILIFGGVSYDFIYFQF